MVVTMHRHRGCEPLGHSISVNFLMALVVPPPLQSLSHAVYQVLSSLVLVLEVVLKFPRSKICSKVRLP